METQNTNQLLVQHACRWGAILGAVSIVIYLLIYIIDYALLANWKMVFLLLVFMGLVVYVSILFRTSVGGFISYGKAFQHGFITFAIMGLVTTFFTVILYEFIDSELPNKLVDESVDNARAMIEFFGVPEGEIDESLERSKKAAMDQFSTAGVLKGYGFALIVYVLLSLITALFVRRNKPEEEIV